MNLDNAQLNEISALLSEVITNFFNKYPIINSIVPAATMLLGLYYVIRGIYGKRKRALEATAFIVFCVYVTLISAAALFSEQFKDTNAATLFSLFAYLLFLSLPAVFCLHIWTQVSWKPIIGPTIVLYSSVPLLLWGIAVYQNFVLGESIDIWNFYIFNPLSLTQIATITYWFFIIIKSFLLCFNVYFQMPAHMRRSTRPITFSLVLLTASAALALFFSVQEMLLFYLLCICVVANRCYYAFFLASSANVISTSREFIFTNLSTMVLVLSKKEHILEWNTHADEKLIFQLIKPKYLQSYKEYREKLLEIGKGIVSPHDENIITITLEGQEYHLLITKKDIKEGNKQYGKLVEIAEITDIYSVLRVMESIAAVDQMTGLYNRNAYLQVARKITQPGRLPLLIILGDVNNLKLVNDSFGHLLGDALLRDVSTIVKQNAPQNAFIARIGGDEIVLLVPNSNEKVAETFVKTFDEIAETYQNEHYGSPSISWGWSLFQDPEEDYNTVFQRADAAMYERKRSFKKLNPFRPSGVLPPLAP